MTACDGSTERVWRLKATMNLWHSLWRLQHNGSGDIYTSSDWSRALVQMATSRRRRRPLMDGLRTFGVRQIPSSCNLAFSRMGAERRSFATRRSPHLWQSVTSCCFDPPCMGTSTIASSKASTVTRFRVGSGLAGLQAACKSVPWAAQCEPESSHRPLAPSRGECCCN